MMETVNFDFSQYDTALDFYQAFALQFQLDGSFGNNLDALWDVLSSGMIPLPICIGFRHLTCQGWQSCVFTVFQDAENELEGELVIKSLTDDLEQPHTAVTCDDKSDTLSLMNTAIIDPNDKRDSGEH